ncbi:MAG: FAD-dependent oxidoreductase [Phycisphaerales bacterium]|nr:FAD-dependent oxidoreductase [Phycisphaerales bacterium]
MTNSSEPSPKKIVIVGGVAGGMSCAARARRISESAEIIVFERGAHVSFANCGLPYHLGGTIAEREKLLVTSPDMLRRRFGIDIRARHEVTAIDRTGKTVTVRNLETGEDLVESYDALVLSPGGKPIVPPIDGIDLPGVTPLRNLEDMDAIKARIDRDGASSAVVIGGGFIGLETAEELRHKGLAVTLLELGEQIFPPLDREMTAPLMQQLSLHGVDVRLGTTAAAIAEHGEALTVTLTTGETVSADVVVLAIGVRPEASLAEAGGLTLGATGGIAVSPAMQTSDESIYAVGDAVEVTHAVTGAPTLIPLAGPANRQGRLAADAIFGRDVSYTATQGTAICKVFDATAAATGINATAAARDGIAAEHITVHPTNHAGYYPGAAGMTLKLLFAPDTGKLLGAQVVGSDGVDKRVDVLATAIAAGMTVFDLEELELAYAPPYGSAKDPVNIAGFVAANVLRGDVALCHPADLDAPTGDQVLLDVRTAGEVAAGLIGDAGATLTIPVDDLRGRLDELPKDKELLVYCAAGLRGYVACRILTQHGYRCANLTGGYKTWTMHHALDAPLAPATPCGKPIEPTPAEQSMTNPITKTIDACGLQCPGPIMQVKSEIDALAAGETLAVKTTDPGFLADIPSWCNSTGNTLISAAPAGGGVYEAVLRKGGAATPELAGGVSTKEKTIVVFSNDFDKVMAAFIIANGAAAMGSQVTLFFTFWGLNVLRKDDKVRVKKTFVERLFGWMMPRGAKKLPLSKMNFAGMGKAMMLGIMKKKNVATLDALIGSAKGSGIKLVACAMSMDVMGIKEEELIDGVEIGGVAMYLDAAERGSMNLFI